MKKYITILVVGIMCVALASCGSRRKTENSELDNIFDGIGQSLSEIDNEFKAIADLLETASSSTPTRGFWEGNVWTSEYLGLAFVLPAGWEKGVSSTDGGIARLVGEGAAIPDTAWDVDSALVDMVAGNSLGGGNINIIIGKLDALQASYLRMTSERAFVSSMVDEFNDEVGVTATVDISTPRIGENVWHSLTVTMEMFGLAFRQKALLSFDGDFMRQITITYDDSATLNEIMAAFSVPTLEIGSIGGLVSGNETQNNPAASAQIFSVEVCEITIAEGWKVSQDGTYLIASNDMGDLRIDPPSEFGSIILLISTLEDYVEFIASHVAETSIDYREIEKKKLAIGSFDDAMLLSFSIMSDTGLIPVYYYYYFLVKNNEIHTFTYRTMLKDSLLEDINAMVSSLVVN
jgi:hypothetical protein